MKLLKTELKKLYVASQNSLEETVCSFKKKNGLEETVCSFTRQP